MCNFDTSNKITKLVYAVPKIFYIPIFIIVIIHFAMFQNRDPLYNETLADILDEVFENFHRQPIKNITLVGPDEDCISKYEPAEMGVWAGSSPGCRCPDGRLYNETCGSKYPSCTDIPPYSPIPFNTWRGHKICVQRSNTLDYSFGGCPSGTVACSSYTCVNPTETCPITDIRVIQETTETPVGYAEVPMEPGYKLIYTAVYGQEYVSDIVVSLYDKPCLDSSKNPTPSDKDPYTLATYGEQGCGKYQEVDDSIVVDSMPVTTLFEDNSITAPLTALPGFSDFITGENGYLVALNRYTIKDRIVECRNISVDTFGLLKFHQQMFVHSVEGISITVLILHCILFFTLIIEVILRVRADEEETHYLKWVSYINLIFFMAIYIMLIIEGKLTMDKRRDIKPITKYIETLQSNYCFEQNEVNSILLLFVQGINKDIFVVASLNLVLFILACVALGIFCILFAVDMVSPRPKEDELPRRAPTLKKGKIKRNLTPNANLEMLIARDT